MKLNIITICNKTEMQHTFGFRFPRYRFVVVGSPLSYEPYLESSAAYKNKSL